MLESPALGSFATRERQGSEMTGSLHRNDAPSKLILQGHPAGKNEGNVDECRRPIGGDSLISMKQGKSFGSSIDVEANVKKRPLVSDGRPHQKEWLVPARCDRLKRKMKRFAYLSHRRWVQVLLQIRDWAQKGGSSSHKEQHQLDKRLQDLDSSEE